MIKRGIIFAFQVHYQNFILKSLILTYKNSEELQNYFYECHYMSQNTNMKERVRMSNAICNRPKPYYVLFNSYIMYISCMKSH